VPELGDLDYAIRGKLMHYAFREMFGKVKSCPRIRDHPAGVG
jgi:hypothetical protein